MDKRVNYRACALYGKQGGLIGGKVLAAKLTPEERSAKARAAANRRWEKEALARPYETVKHMMAVIERTGRDQLLFMLEGNRALHIDFGQERTLPWYPAWAAMTARRAAVERRNLELGRNDPLPDEPPQKLLGRFTPQSTLYEIYDEFLQLAPDAPCPFGITSKR